ncbi:MAG: hypothetical protein Fur0010_26430 [Bdellovibrio sp.]
MMAYCDGEETAFAELYQRYKSRIYGYLQNKVPPKDRDDLFQSSFIKLIEKRHLYKNDYPFAPWFFTLVRNNMIDHMRKQKRESVELNEFDIAVLDQKVTELPQWGLSEEEMTLLYEKFVEGKGYSELEEEFNTKSSTLRKRVSRIIERIKGLSS